MITKADIDREFEANYADLIGLCRSMIYKNKKRHEASAVVSEAYLYLLSKADELKELKDVRIFAIKFIRDGLRWTNSSINKKGEILNRRAGEIKIEDFSKGKKLSDCSEDYTESKIGSNKLERFLLEKFESENQDLEDKIETERRETAAKVLKVHYKTGTKDPVLKRLFTVYFEEKRDTVRKIAEFYGISKDSAATEIKELLTDVRRFAESNGYIQNAN